MSTNTLTVIDNKERVLSAALSGLSPNTCRVYKRHLSNFLAAVPILDREHVSRYMSTIPDTSNYNQTATWHALWHVAVARPSQGPTDLAGCVHARRKARPSSPGPPHRLRPPP
jgi:hypothetical protein